MPDESLRTGDAVTFSLPVVDDLIAVLLASGRTVLGPVVRDGAVVLGELGSGADLARYVVEEQEKGRYRLHPEAGAAFGYTHGPDSVKRALHPPACDLVRARRAERSFSAEGAPPPRAPLALFGLRGCDLAALRVLDRALLGGPSADPVYAARRDGAFVVALTCTRPGGTCFCASMGTGPRPEGIFDIRLTELRETGEPRLLAEAGSARGAALLAAVPHDPAPEADLAAAERIAGAAARAQKRKLETDGLEALLSRAWEHPQFDEVARRCLACGSCTLVCPTCFCTTVGDRTDLSGAEAVRTRRWDSCFSPDYSFLHGGSVRSSIRARYRQWLMHKLATWTEQFGLSGCVGCGRCITWCPAGIDLTEEAWALGRTTGTPEGSPHGNA
ncbi:MAG: 4Fe-4S dicluster domain-containing protein [Thermoanaerobaculia bacterium]